MRICWRLGITREQWRALPDSEKDEWLAYLDWRERQLERGRKKLVEKKGYTPEVAALLLIERS
jgi:hypothetical protein